MKNKKSYTKIKKQLYRGYIIYFDNPSVSIKDCDYGFYKADEDVAEVNFAKTAGECKKLIDKLLDSKPLKEETLDTAIDCKDKTKYVIVYLRNNRKETGMNIYYAFLITDSFGTRWRSRPLNRTVTYSYDKIDLIKRYVKNYVLHNKNSKVIADLENIYRKYGHGPDYEALKSFNEQEK